MNIVVLGLSITSSWGNDHALTYRGLLHALTTRGHHVHFLERDVPWYAENRDLPHPPYAKLSLYKSTVELVDRFARTVRDADVVLVGSLVADGIEIGRWVQNTARGVVAFYDLETAVTLANLAAGTCEYLAPDLVPRYQLYLSVTGGPTLRRIERDLGSPCARALYGSVDPELYYPEARSRRWDMAYMGTYSPSRQPAVKALLIDPARRDPSLRFVVAGPAYPAEIESPPNVEQITHLPPGEHRDFYNSASFALHLTRKEMAIAGWSPGVRMFEAAACGVPIISDVWDGIGDVFAPGHEILLARTADDIARILHDGAPFELGARARQRVLAAHTPAHRAAELERAIQEVCA